MSQSFVKTKPSLMEAGLPCSSLSAECQRDNNARQRPPQNRLHIWWARRPPTVCRVAIVSALLPHDVKFNPESLPQPVPEPEGDDIEQLPAKFSEHAEFFRRLIDEVGPTALSTTHAHLLRALGIAGDPDRAFRRMEARLDYLIGNKPILLPMSWTYRHPPAFGVSPNDKLLNELLNDARGYLGVNSDDPVVMLDFMAGGGAIPLEGIRHGLKVYSNDLNPVAALVQKATLEYPARFGRALAPLVRKYAEQVDVAVRERLLQFFYAEPGRVWWAQEKDRASLEFKSKEVVRREPADRRAKSSSYMGPMGSLDAAVFA